MFVVLALPRSRTYWLSRLLSFNRNCHHETAIFWRSIDEVKTFFCGGTGSVETGVSPGWRLLRHHIPNLRMAVVRRPTEDCVQSTLRIPGLVYDEALLRKNYERMARALDEVSRQPNVLTVTYAQLATEEGCATLFEHCLGEPMPYWWWRSLRDENLQCDAASYIVWAQEHRGEIDTFKAAAWREMHRLVRSGEIRSERYALG